MAATRITLVLVGGLGCGEDRAPVSDAGVPDAGAPDLVRVWLTEPFAGCLLASPLRADLADGTRVVVASGDGRVAVLDPLDGTIDHDVTLPHPEGETSHVIATPAIAPGNRLVVAWQQVDLRESPDPTVAPRSAHRVAMVNLEAGALDSGFATLTLAASQPDADGTGTVEFRADHALSRSRLAHAPLPGSDLGLVYVSFGNARDIQPWHGWVFEIDLERWRDAGPDAAIANVLLTTPESDCGPKGKSGSRDMICGGGVWAPTGPEVLPTDAGEFELVVPTGNGQLDLGRRDYAHALMRIPGPGLDFDDGCDPVACAGWDALDPSTACMESCEHLFIPRLLPGESPFESPPCEGMSFFECYAALDWDLGANSPAPVVTADGSRLLLLPAKDGGVYLIDAEHLGTLHDRLEIAPECGSDGASCRAYWMGMMVTRPEVTQVDGVPLAVIATFVADDQHAAGLVGMRVAEGEDGPRLEQVWEAPPRDTEEARAAFRRHPSGVRLLNFAGEEFAAVVDQGEPGGRNGILYLVRVADGSIVHRAELDGPGQRYSQPLAVDDLVIAASCIDGNAGPGHLEAWRLTESAR